MTRNPRIIRDSRIIMEAGMTGLPPAPSSSSYADDQPGLSLFLPLIRYRLAPGLLSPPPFFIGFFFFPPPPSLRSFPFFRPVFFLFRSSSLYFFFLLSQHVSFPFCSYCSSVFFPCRLFVFTLSSLPGTFPQTYFFYLALFLLLSLGTPSLSHSPATPPVTSPPAGCFPVLYTHSHI